MAQEEKDWSKGMLAINPDYVGWLTVYGTTADGPVVQGEDNNEYLRTDIYGEHATAGTLFMDSIVNMDSGGNLIIYGHHMKNGTMFAQLLKFREKSFLKKHNEIMIFTPDRTIHLKVISAYAQKAQNKIPVTFANDKQKKAYIKKIESMSEQTIKTSRINDSHIYTFVTCSYEGEDNRTYVHAAEE